MYKSWGSWGTDCPATLAGCKHFEISCLVIICAMKLTCISIFRVFFWKTKFAWLKANFSQNLQRIKMASFDCVQTSERTLMILLIVSHLSNNMSHQPLCQSLFAVHRIHDPWPKHKVLSAKILRHTFRWTLNSIFQSGFKFEQLKTNVVSLTSLASLKTKNSLFS